MIAFLAINGIMMTIYLHYYIHTKYTVYKQLIHYNTATLRIKIVTELFYKSGHILLLLYQFFVFKDITKDPLGIRGL